MADTYASLKTDIADELNRVDLSDTALSRFIRHAEASIGRKLIAAGGVREMIGRSDATVTDEFIAVPADFQGARTIYVTGSTIPLTFAEPEKIVELKTLYPFQACAPQRFSVVGGSLQFWPWTGTSYDLEMTYWAAIPGLSNTNTSNWLLASHPDAYLYASCMNGSLYLKDNAAAQTWGALLTNSVNEIVAAGNKSQQSAHIAVTPVPGGTP